MPRMLRLLALAAALAAGSAAGSASLGAGEPAKVDITHWEVPDVATAGDDPFGKLVKYGHALFTDTANQIGPSVPDPARRFAGNNLTCQSCHLQAGSQAFGLSLVGVWGQYPQYSAREARIASMEERVNGCMMRSMNGQPLPDDSREMIALLSYMRWLSIGVPVGAKLAGAKTLPIKEPNRAADPARGGLIYAQVCAACHGPDGLGMRAQAGAGYQVPPLWGPDSYNDGAGMDRLLTTAAFVMHNMPLGTRFDAPVLTDEDAYDVAAFVDSQPRPHKADLDKDYPIRSQKPVDSAHGPYADDFSAEQHKFGPFEPIRAKLRELAQPARKMGEAN